MAKWPEYNYIAKLDDGRWRAEVQNSAGKNWSLTFKDPIMAEAECKGQAERLGVSVDFQVFWNLTIWEGRLV